MQDLDKIALFREPHPVLFDEPVDDIFAAADYNYALIRGSNKLYSWGRGDNYVLGSRQEENLHEPTIVNPKMF